MTRFSRSIVIIMAVLCPALSACEEESDAGSSVVINSWLQQGLGPATFQALDNKALGKDATCKQGTLSGIETTLCQYPNPEAAKAARPAGLAHVGEVTGAALPAGNLLLIVADRDKADPLGRKINEIVSIFRDKAPKPAEPATDEAAKPGDTPESGKNESNQTKTDK